MFLRTVTFAAAMASAIATDYTSPCGNMTISDAYPNRTNVPTGGSRGEDPPYWGTIFVERDIITPDDRTTYKKKTYKGTGMTWMYDRRVGWITVNAYLYEAKFKKGAKVTFAVHEEFNTETDAAAVVDSYVKDVGQIPMVMLKNLSQVWIMKGDNLWGGGSNSDGTGHILIHTDMGDSYRQDGIVAEVMMHEGAHASLDSYLYNDEWYKAAESDNNYISTYAKNNPRREDISETILLYFAVAYTKKRLSDEDMKTITTTIPYRIAYLNSLNLDMFPFKKLNVCRNKEVCGKNNFCKSSRCNKSNQCKHINVKNCVCIKRKEECSELMPCCSLNCKKGKCK